MNVVAEGHPRASAGAEQGLLREVLAVVSPLGNYLEAVRAKALSSSLGGRC